MMAFQGLISGWVRVNQKHVFFPPQDDQQQQKLQQEQQANDGVLMDATPSSKHGKDNTLSNIGNSKSIKTSKKEQISHGTATTMSTMDAETQAIRRFKNRSHNRRLKRTVSHTDLLREMAKGKEKDAKQTPTSPNATPSDNELKDAAPATRPQQLENEKSKEEHSTEDSLRFVAGFFGTDIIDPNNLANDQILRSKIAGRNLNENQQGQQFEGTRKAMHHSRQNLPSHEPSISDASFKRHLVATKSDSPFNDDSINSGVSGRTPSIQGTHPLQKPDNKSNPFNHFFRFPQGRHHCASCDELEGRLLATHADMEYLRSVALRNEYTCSLCELDTNEKPNSIKSAIESATVREASKQLADITLRHQRQMEEIVKEQSRWQQDMNIKLSKVSSVCRNLKNETETLKQESLDLQLELTDTRKERDSLFAQVDKSRAEATLFERERVEHQMLREILQKYETNGLAKAHEAVEKREQIIRDLSVRLERTLETLDLERQQQKQRRQIIFPTRNSLSHTGGDTSSNEVTAIKEELKRANESAQEAQANLQFTKREADRIDEAWMLRCLELERQVQSLQIHKNV